jgi:hypothetical protein
MRPIFNNKTLCEACEKLPVSHELENGDFLDPFYLCESCHAKAITFSLFPREWYNLTVIHGLANYYVCSDFYDDDGTAGQPYHEFVHSEQEVVPHLDAVKTDPQQLIDYALTKFRLDDKILACFLHFDKDALLTLIRNRFNQTKVLQNQATLLEIASKTGSNSSIATQWIRELCQKDNLQLLVDISKVAIHLLPFEEAWAYIIKSLNTLPEKNLPDIAFSCLHLFRASAVLDWMAPKVKSYHDSWASLAAVSNLHWEIIEKWINSGRPLSLIALEAMARGGVANCPSRDRVKDCLLVYEKRDAAPRVSKAIAYIRAHVLPYLSLP